MYRCLCLANLDHLDHKGPTFLVRSSFHLVFGRPCFLVQSLGVKFVALIVQRLSDSRAMTCPSMLSFPDSVDDMAYASFLTDPGVSLSISKGNAGSSIMIALYSVHVSQQYVITGKMYSSCIFLFILMLALRLLMMLFTSPRLPNQVRSAS